MTDESMTALKEMLVRHEGMRLNAYKDTVGKWTVGVGRNLDDKGITEDEFQYITSNFNGFKSFALTCNEFLNDIKGIGITKEIALYLLDNDIAECEEKLKRLTFYDSLSDIRKMVLISMCFNLGFWGLVGFT
ncbi:MAG: hypothetical protein H7844_13030 [Nitrospirae bacterium YQR-1]